MGDGAITGFGVPPRIPTGICLAKDGRRVTIGCSMPANLAKKDIQFLTNHEREFRSEG
jgi:hypothetical protein